MDAMSARLARNWWALLVRGLLAIAFGLYCLVLPIAAIRTLELLFAAYMAVDGVFAIVAAARAAAHHERWGLLILEGIVNFIAAAIALFWPGITVFVFVVMLGVWAIVSGVLLAASAFRLHLAHGRWWMLVSGLISIAWGVLLWLAPLLGAVVLTWWLGIYALAFGVMLLVLAVRLRARHHGSAGGIDRFGA